MPTAIGRYFDPWEAHILRARLAAEGVPASVTGDQHIIANWPLSVALGGVVLQVPGEYLAQAQEIVAAYHAGTLEHDLLVEHPEATENCPTCGATDVTRTVPLGQQALTVTTFLLASAPFPTSASRMQCRACNHRWQYGG